MKFLLRIVKSLYINIADEIDEMIKPLVKNLKFSLLNNALEILKKIK